MKSLVYFSISILLTATGITSCRSTENSESETQNVFKKKQKKFVETTERINTDASKEKLILSFTGKGTALAWDVGIMNVLYPRVKALRDNNVVLTGSSSGSIWATYFACFGISAESIERMKKLVAAFDKDLVNDGAGKTKDVLLGQMHKYHYPHSNLDEVIAIGLDDMKCKPKLPIVIAAANVEPTSRTFRYKRWGKDRQFPYGNKDILGKIDPDNYNVYNSIGKFYGKSCTYFVDQSMFDKLKMVSPERRKCDLRLMEDAEDMKDAILATVSEPTYFEWWTDRDPSKIFAYIRGKDGYSKQQMGLESRRYNGGYVLTVVTEDVKRLFPTAYTISTGRFPLTGIQNGLLKHWYMADGNMGMFQGQWWLDADIVPTEEFWAASEAKLWPAEKEIKAGQDATLAAIKSEDDARPRKDWMISPKFKQGNVDGKPVDLTMYRDRGLRAIIDKDKLNQ